MTKREQERIDRLLAELGHESVIGALKHALRMRSVLRAMQTWGAANMEADAAWRLATYALRKTE